MRETVLLTLLVEAETYCAHLRAMEMRSRCANTECWLAVNEAQVPEQRLEVNTRGKMPYGGMVGEA